MGGILKSAGSALGFGTSTAGVNGAGQMSEDEAFRQLQILKAQEPNQRAFGDQLYNQAAGKAPSLAEAQMRSAQDRNIAQQIALAKSNRSANAGLQSRNLQMNASLGGQQLNQAVGQARLQEQQANQAQYSNYLNGLQGHATNMLNSNIESQKNAFSANSANDKTMREGAGQFAGMLGGGTAYLNGMFGSSGTAPAAAGGQGGAQAGMMQNAAMAGMMMAYKGAKVPGTPLVEGDSPINDTVTAKVSPGEVIVPRTVVQEGPKAVSAFVRALAQQSAPVETSSGFGSVVAAQADFNKRLAEIKSKYGK